MDGLQMKGETMSEETEEQTSEVSTDEPVQESAVVVVLSEDPNTDPGVRRRRIRRREEVPFTNEERMQIDDEIVEANGNLIETEKEKSAQTKLYNGHIAEYRQTLDDAIEVLRKGVFTYEMERVEEFNYNTEEVIYYDVETDKEIDRRDMTPEELQTKMKM